MIYKSYLLEQNLNSVNEKFILFYGENLGLKEEFKKKIKLHQQDAKIIYLFQEDVIKNEEKFFNEILNFSLFEKKKIFIINNINDKILPIIHEIEKKIEEQKIYFFSEILERKSKLRSYFEKSKHTATVACYADNEVAIKKIILEKLKNFKGLSAENINMIIESSNLDRIKLYNEINKIVTYFIDKTIEKNKLESLLNMRVNDDFSTLRDEALIGNKIETNKGLSDTTIVDEKNILYLSIINQRLNKLNEVSVLSKLSSIENAINMIKPPIFWKDKPIIIKQIKKLNLNKIKKILNKTYELEVKMKSNSVINKNVLVKKLLVDICALASA